MTDTKPSADALWRGGRTGVSPEPLVHHPPATAVTAPLAAPRPSLLSRRRLILTGLQLIVFAISALVIWLLLRKVNLAAAVSDAGHLSWRLLALAIALNIVPTVLRAMRSQLLVQRLGHRVPFLRMNGVDLAGQTLSWITPAATGDLSRPYLWRTHDRVPVSTGVAVVIYERLATLLQLGVVGGVLAATVYLPIPVVVGVAAAGAIFLVAPWWVSLLTRRFIPATAGRRPGLVGGFARALVQLERLGLSLKVTAVFAVLSLAVFVVSGLQVLLLVWGIGFGANLGVAIAAYCVSQVAGSISTLPFGFGATDAVMLGLLMAGGLARVDAVAVTVLARLVMTLPLGAAGAASIMLLGRPEIPAEAPARPAAQPTARIPPS
ncbi:MAG TPA: lysylphosphatidylglycerol synthase transmembrane domain-containing protein [Candidatus Binatia bacterium]|nr:lysylphosphatidylglycerol synthase transmembrane domain-containing protein [Candidatus Binatia bacterium]